MKRISLITESSARPDEAMPAYLFYQGTMSRWINTVIKFMECREFPREDIFFLSFNEYRIIGYEDIVEPYPKQKFHPRASHANEFARKTLEFVLSMDPLPFVEIHAGRTLVDPLKRLFEEHGISFRIYADGVPLGMKPSYYENLIEEEQDKRKLREIQKEKWDVLSLVKKQNHHEASEIVTRYSKRAHLYGIEKNIEELKALLGGFYQKQKDEKKAMRDFELLAGEEDGSGKLIHFLKAHESLADLHANAAFEEIKNQFGKSVAKYILLLIKRNYVLLMENKISEALFRTQIALMK